MLNWFFGLSPVIQALFATLFTWFVTLLGASIVFFFKEVKKGIMDALLGFSAGVMIAASFWSLLSPAIDMADNMAFFQKTQQKRFFNHQKYKKIQSPQNKQPIGPMPKAGEKPDHKKV